jgi:hypothetical protein
MSASSKIIFFVIVLLMLLFLTFMMPALAAGCCTAARAGMSGSDAGAAVPFVGDGVILSRIVGGGS